MGPSRTRPSSFVAFLLAIAVVGGLLAAFDRSTPGGARPSPTLAPILDFRTPSSVIAEPNRRQSVVLISLGGASADTLSGWMADGVMPALSHLAEQGWMTTLHSVSPPLPGFALKALATGATFSSAEPIWQRAARHHRTTALLFWPGTDPAMADQRADYTLACAQPLTTAGQQTILLSPGTPWTGAPASSSPPYEGTLTLPLPVDVATWHVLAVDTLDDEQAVYDTFFLTPDSDRGRAVNRNTAQLSLDDWVTLPISGQAAPGLMLAVTGLRTLTSTATLSPTVSTSLTATATLSPTASTSLTATATLTPTVALSPTVSSMPLLELTLYRIPAQSVVARPVALGQEVMERFGFCPPLPGPRTIAQGQLSPSAFRELASLRAHWAMRVAAYVYETFRPHLLMVRQEAVSPSEQALLLATDRQPGYTPARAAEFAGHRRVLAAAVDDGLDDLLAVMDLNYAAVLIVSEYGIAPAHTQVNVTAAVRPVWQWLAQLDGGLLSNRASPGLHVEGAFLSVDVELDEEGEGKVATDAIIRALAGLTDPRTGEPIFARVLRRSGAGLWGEAWPYPGDILAQAVSGYMLAAGPSTGDVFSNATVYGQMGYSTGQPAMQGVLIAAGRDVSSGQAKDVTHLLDVSSAMADWLGLPK